MEVKILGHVLFETRSTLHVLNDEAIAQAETEGLPVKGVVNDATREFDPKAGHGGYYPPIKGFSDEQNYTSSSEVVGEQLKKSTHRNIGEFPRGKIKI